MHPHTSMAVSVALVVTVKVQLVHSNTPCRLEGRLLKAGMVMLQALGGLPVAHSPACPQ